MFHTESNASKLAFITLCKHFSQYGGALIDCQMMTPHLQSLGVQETTRTDFYRELQRLRDNKVDRDCWRKQKIE